MKEFPRVEQELSIDDQEFPRIEQEFPEVEQVNALAIVTKARKEGCVTLKKRRGRPSLGGDKRKAANTRERNRMRGLGRSVIAYIREEFV